MFHNCVVSLNSNHRSLCWEAIECMGRERLLLSSTLVRFTPARFCSNTVSVKQSHQTQQVKMIPIQCPAQNYAWGKLGSSSLVAQLKSNADGNPVDETKTYAELWMGTHPSGPARAVDGHLLSEKLKETPEAVGFVPEDYVPNDLPFLFKVLSIQTALSIQAHPDKSRASRLHSKFPDIYKDPNHKPEMVIALGDFECLSGFRTKSEILELTQQYPEFAQLLTAAGFALSESPSLSDQDFIKQASIAYLNCNHEIVTTNLRPMIHRLREKTSTDLEQLLIRLYDQYPDDIGVFAPLLLNYLKMQQGDSFFIGPNVPHAYISGDCVECMALSDNVVRAGLTPKLRDVETLCEMLTYSSGKPAFIDTVAVDDHTRLYRPPKTDCAEFEVEEIRLTEPSSVALRALPAASLVLVLSAPSPLRAVSTANDNGLTTELSLPMGSVFFLASNAQVNITASSPGEYLLYRAHVNLA